MLTFTKEMPTTTLIEMSFLIIYGLFHLLLIERCSNIIYSVHEIKTRKCDPGPNEY